MIREEREEKKAFKVMMKQENGTEKINFKLTIITFVVMIMIIIIDDDCLGMDRCLYQLCREQRNKRAHCLFFSSF